MKQFPKDIKLIENLKKGDLKAFDLVYEKYSPKLYAFALKYLKSVEETEELVQSVFLKLWENQQNLKQETSFKSYLFTIAYNEICNVFRRRKYQQAFMDDALSEKSEASSSTEDKIDYQFVLQQLETIISKLERRKNCI